MRRLRRQRYTRGVTPPVLSWLFVSDLHGELARYRCLFDAVRHRLPEAVLFGGDLLPRLDVDAFLHAFLIPQLRRLRSDLGADYPRMLVILGNDDDRLHEQSFREAEAESLLVYVHGRSVDLDRWRVYGYSCVPPTPFLNKDWERYDVSRGVDPGCVPPEEGSRSMAIDPEELRRQTIANDLEELCGDADLEDAVMLFHSPPYRSKLDRAALVGQSIDHAPLDVHVGSIAIRRLIEQRQPLVTLHGHIHESPRLTGSWRDRIGRTHAFTAAHDGPELALISFDPADPASATRELVPSR
jgi:Icc-related predicted phosphoesterase